LGAPQKDEQKEKGLIRNSPSQARPPYAMVKERRLAAHRSLYLLVAMSQA